MRLLDYQHLGSLMPEARERYRDADPFPHIMIDDFLTPQVVSALAPHFPQAVVKAGQEDRSADTAEGAPAQYRKRWVSREAAVDIAIRRLYWELNSGAFIKLLEQMTGIENLLPDPYLLGGGVHQTIPGGYLRVHADFNEHPELHLDRRVNLLIYFNEDWPASYGGDLELWNEDMSECRQQIAPLAGRCVIFSTTSSSLHGHPRPLTCPEGRTRKSLALYFYTNGRPEGESAGSHATLWHKLPDETR
jgi:hypothetical protein